MWVRDVIRWGLSLCGTNKNFLRVTRILPPLMSIMKLRWPSEASKVKATPAKATPKQGTASLMAVQSKKGSAFFLRQSSAL